MSANDWRAVGTTSAYGQLTVFSKSISDEEEHFQMDLMSAYPLSSSPRRGSGYGSFLFPSVDSALARRLPRCINCCRGSPRDEAPSENRGGSQAWEARHATHQGRGSIPGTRANPLQWRYQPMTQARCTEQRWSPRRCASASVLRYYRSDEESHLLFANR